MGRWGAVVIEVRGHLTPAAARDHADRRHVVVDHHEVTSSDLVEEAVDAGQRRAGHHRERRRVHVAAQVERRLHILLGEAKRPD